MKVRKGLLAGLAVALLIGSSAAYAAPAGQPLALSVGGTVTNLGNQTYKVHGTQLIFGSVDGFQLGAASTTIDYRLNAQVKGVKTSGTANIDVTGTIPGSPTTNPVSWSSTGGTTASGHQSERGRSQACDGSNHGDSNGKMQCQVEFTPSSTGVAVVTAQYPGDSYNAPSSDTFTIFVGSVHSSPATSTSLTCDQARLQPGESTNCTATVTDADSSPESAGVTWTSSNGGTFASQSQASHRQTQGCGKSDHDGQMECDVQFTAGTAGPAKITATYTPSDTGHTASNGSYSAFVGVFGPSTATATSLTCDQNRIDAKDNTNCQATVLTSYAGTSISLDVTVDINSQIGTGVPLGCDVSGSSTPCNSLLPTYFTGGADITLSVGNGGSDQSQTEDQSQTSNQQSASSTLPQFVLESPYFNPFGGPIVIASVDGSITLVSSYKTGTIDWRGTQVTGAMFGVLGAGTTPNAFGTFGLTTTEHEDLVAGTTTDSGTMTFSQFTSSLSSTPINLVGSYKGTSLIPTLGSPACALEQGIFGTTPPCVADCSALTGVPGTCTETGFQSNGQFNLKQGKISIAGTYSTTWSVPALGFVSTVGASVTQQSQH